MEPPMRRLLFIALIVLIPLTVACRPLVNSGNNVAVVEPLAGGEFNKFFPKDDGDYDVLFTQEKAGFAQAKLNFQGSEVATLAVTDTANAPDALAKFQDTDQAIAGYPAAAVGELGTAILVADRFQVQVRAKDASFDAAAREEWIELFDLDGLAGLE